jgi:hypothetical protein
VSIAAQRLANQGVSKPRWRRPADVVAWLGAAQAQEYAAAKWALGLRMATATVDADLERAVNDGRILRTHVLRPTWHFVAPADLRWMLELTAPQVHRTVASYTRRLELDTRTFTRAASIFERALADGRHLTRAELRERLAAGGIVAAGLRLAFLAMYAELEGVICSGARRGTEFTYALAADRAPGGRPLPRDEALAELARRYFRSHGPATARDFMWWSGLKAADARRGIDIVRPRQFAVGGRTYWTLGNSRATQVDPAAVYLLPIYDEYLVAYRNRDVVPHRSGTVRSASRGDITFQHALVIAGQVAGTWRTGANRAGTIDVIPSRRLTRVERHAILDAAGRFERFLGRPVSVSIDGKRATT